MCGDRDAENELEVYSREARACLAMARDQDGLSSRKARKEQVCRMRVEASHRWLMSLGRSWRELQEMMPGPCSIGPTGTLNPRHRVPC